MYVEEMVSEDHRICFRGDRSDLRMIGSLYNFCTTRNSQGYRYSSLSFNIVDNRSHINRLSAYSENINNLFYLSFAFYY